MKTKLVYLFIVIFMVSACTTVIDWDNQIDKLINGQSYVIPIGETTLTLNNIIEQLDTIHLKGGDNIIYLQFKDTVVWNFREIANIKNLDPFGVVYELYNGPIQYELKEKKTTSKEHTIDLNINTDVDGQHIDSLFANGAMVDITISTSNIDNIQANNIKIITHFKSGVLAFENGTGHGTDSTFIYMPEVLNAPNSPLKLNPFILTTENNLSKLDLKVFVEVTPGSTPIILKPNAQINLTYRIYDVDTKVFYGKFKPVLANGINDKTVDLTEYIQQLPSRGIFKLAEPQITFSLENNSGIKMNLMVDTIMAYKVNDPISSKVLAKFSGSESTTKVIDRVISYNRKLSTPVIPVKSSFVLDYTPENGEISHFFDTYPLPDRVKYKFKLTNARVDSDPLDFMTNNGNITAHINVKVPLKFNAGSSFELVDTLENIDMNELIDMEVIDNMLLMLKVTNNLPLKGELSLKFLDSNKVPIDDLKVLSDSIIDAPSIDENGLVLAGSNAVSDLKIVVENSQLPKLRLAKHLVYTIKVESKENQKITLQKENYIKLKLGKYSIAE